MTVDDGWERQLVGALVRQGRSFVNSLRYNSPGDQSEICASLLDRGKQFCPLFIDRESNAEVEMVLNYFGPAPDCGAPVWLRGSMTRKMHVDGAFTQPQPSAAFQHVGLHRYLADYRYSTNLLQDQRRSIGSTPGADGSTSVDEPRSLFVSAQVADCS